MYSMRTRLNNFSEFSNFILQAIIYYQRHSPPPTYIHPLPSTSSTKCSFWLVDQTQAQLSMEYFVSNLGQTDQAVLTVILQEVKALSLTHPDLLTHNIDKVSKLSQNGSSAVRILVQQLREDNQKRSGRGTGYMYLLQVPIKKSLLYWYKYMLLYTYLNTVSVFISIKQR